MKKDIFIRLLATVVLLSTLLYGCKDDNELVFSEPAVIAIQDASDKPVEVTLLNPKIKTLNIRAIAQSKSAQNVTITFKIDRALVEEYNKTNGTSYEIIPAEAYDWSETEVILPRYNEISSTVKLTLNSNKMPDDRQYLLPITIDEIKGDELAQQATTNNVYYVLFNKRELPPPVILDRTNWSIPYVSSELQAGEGTPKTGWIKDVLDGKLSTYWNYDYKAPIAGRYAPFWIVFDLGEEVTIRGIKISARLNNPLDPSKGHKYSPCEFIVETAKTITGNGMSNSSDWTYNEKYTPAEVPNQMYPTVYLDKPQRARYIRFKLIWSYTAGGSSAYKGGSFSEFDVWGNIEDIELE